MNRRLVGVTLLLCVAAGLVTACTADAGDSASTGARAPVQGGAGDSAPQQEKPGAAGAENISQPGVDRTLVRTATIALTAADVGDVVDSARGIAIAAGGYAGQEEVRESSATLTLRIPSDQFDEALTDLSGLGDVVSRRQSAEDVTEQVVDLDSRIATQRASVDRVRTLLAKAATVDEIVRIEQELTTREADLESLEQRMTSLSGQAAMSTVTLTVDKKNKAAPMVTEEESGGFVTGLSDGWSAFIDFGTGALRVIGAVLPFLVVLGVPAVFVIRWRRRRRPVPAPAVPDSA
jgi:Domain of unknown function (DUF4349)